MVNVLKTDVEELYNRKGNFAKKLENKFSIQYPLVILVFVLFLYVVGFLISVKLGNINAFLHSWTFSAGSMCLFVAATIILWFESSYFTVILDARGLFNVSDETYYNWLHDLILRFYKPGWYILFGLPILVLGLQGVIRFCLSRPQEFWPGISVELMASNLFVSYVVVWIIVVSVVVGFITYLAIGACCKVAPRLAKLPIIFNFLHPDGMFGLRPLLSYFLKIMALYFFDASVASAVFLTKPDLGTYVFVAGISLPGLVGFLVVFYCVHKSIAVSKKELLSEISAACSSYIRPPISIPDNGRTQAMLLLFREIKDKSDWPINTGILAKTIGLLFSPTISFLTKILLDYLVKSA